MIATVTYPAVTGLAAPAARAAAVDAALFFGLVWGTLALVAVVFAYILYGVVRAGGIELSSGGH